MNYKLELWKYDTFGYEAAEAHLNEMAQRGLELVSISLNWLPLAAYRRSELAKEKRYAVEIIDKDDEEQFQLYQETGWTKVIHLKNSQCVFETTDKDARPLFTDVVSKYQNAVEVIRNSTAFAFNIIGGIVFVGLLLYIFGNDVMQDMPRIWKYFFYLIIAMSTVQIAAYLGSFFYLKRAVVDAEGHIRKQLGICRWLESFNAFFIAGFFLTGFFLFLVTYGWLRPSLLGVTASLFMLALILGGCVFNALLGKKVVGNVMIVLGIWIFYMLLLQMARW